MYPVFKEMEIDEDKKKYDLSDHCLSLIKLNLEVSQENLSKTKNKENNRIY